MNLVPATVLTGFLGSGKSTLLRRILTEAHGLRIAVIENEFAQENIDSEIIAVGAGDDRIIQLSNGCVCCSIREDLRATLESLARRREAGEIAFDRVVIETTGLADPGPVAQTFFLDEQVSSRYRPDAIVTMVDAKHGMHQLDERREARRQAGFADRLFLTKTDLVDAAEVNALGARLAAMNPRAPQRRVSFGDAPLSEVFDIGGFDLSADLDLAEPSSAHGGHAHHHHHHADDVESFVFRAERPLHGGRFAQFLNAAVQAHGDRLLRYKGVLNIAGVNRKVILQGVHQLTSSDLGPSWLADELRSSRLVFIGHALPQTLFLSSLERCLVASSVS